MKFLNIINRKIKPFDVYAVHKGTFLGHLLIFIQYDPIKDMYGFISMQNLQNVEVPSKDLKEGIDNKLLRKTDIKLQSNIRTVCNKQFTFNIENKGNNSKIDMNEDLDIGLQ